MRSLTGSVVAIVVFAVSAGHFTWVAFLGPAVNFGSFIGEHAAAPVLVSPDPGSRRLYLRRELYIPQQPRHAWIEVLGFDQIELHVNGKFVNRAKLDGFPVAIVADLTAFLEPGLNVIAVQARQAQVAQAPMIAVNGAFTLSDGEHAFGVDSEWRAGTHSERLASWWFAREFDDRHWPLALVQKARLRASVATLPRALKQPDRGVWIAPIALDQGRASFRRAFEVDGRPESAFLRLTTSSDYRLSINGVMIDQHEDQLAVHTSRKPVRRIYDITPVLHSGRNVVAVALTDACRTPHLQVDAEIQLGSGQLVQMDSDAKWLTAPGMPKGWADADELSSVPWYPAATDIGDMVTPPWQMRTQVIEETLPLAVLVGRGIRESAWMLLLGGLVYAVCRVVAWYVPALSFASAALCLIAPSIGLISGMVSTGDPRIEPADVYRMPWLVAVILSILVQWAFLAYWNPQFSVVTYVTRITPKRLAIIGYVALVSTIGLWLRARDLYLEPLQWDEVENYLATLGLLKSGFPNVTVHSDLPPAWTHTSELEFYFHGLVGLFSSDSYLIMRLPSIFFSTISIGLMYLAGRRLFNTPVGLIAATLLAIAPSCVLMSTIGRYFSQLQFFTLLTVVCLWEAIRGAGPISGRRIWLTVAGFLGMFLSWEASALIAPGLVIAALMQRRGRISSVLVQPAVWWGGALVFLILMLQRSHATLSQTQFLWYGVSLSDIRLIPMWNSQAFQPWYYLWETSWNQDLLLPLCGILGALMMAIRGPYLRQARFVLIIHVTNCLLMGLLLPTCQFRYVHHLVPLPILLCSAALVVVARSIAKLAEHSPSSKALGSVVAVGFVGAYVLLGNGASFELRRMDGWRIEGMPPRLFKYPDIGGPSRYVRDHMRPGDIVLANHVYQVNHLMELREAPDPATRYTVSTGALFLPATLTDNSDQLVDRRDGTRMITSVSQLEGLFARHRRIWYIVQPGQHSGVNAPSASAFLRRYMEVVYEDVEMQVLFFGGEHRTAFVRDMDDRALSDGKIDFLP